MPVYEWLVHFPDDQATSLGVHREIPHAGDEIVAGWVVTVCTILRRQARRDQVDIWVTENGRR